MRFSNFTFIFYAPLADWYLHKMPMLGRRYSKSALPVIALLLVRMGWVPVWLAWMDAQLEPLKDSGIQMRLKRAALHGMLARWINTFPILNR